MHRHSLVRPRAAALWALEKLLGVASWGRSDGLAKEGSSGGLARPIAYDEARLGASPPWAPSSFAPSVSLPSAARLAWRAS